MKTNTWTLLQGFDEYYDYEKELCSLPDEGNTSIDLRMTFDTAQSDCYFTISMHNDSGNTKDWEQAHHIPWSVGVAMLRADGVEIPEELT